MWMTTCVTFICCLLLIASNVEGGISKAPVIVDFSEYVNHYAEMGCDPILPSGVKTPERYDCPFLKHVAALNDKCLYKKQLYNVGHKFDTDLIEDACHKCQCVKNQGSKPKIDCAIDVCPEKKQSSGRRSGQCVNQFNLGKCCRQSEVCDNGVKGLKTCTWRTKTYKEGERFNVAGKACKTCVCSKEYDGSLNGAWCRRTECGIEIYNNAQFTDKCAPIYMKDQPCCPYNWKCPKAEYTISKLSQVKNAKPEMKCHFGDQTLNIGDKVSVDKDCINCSCKFPPLVTCVDTC